MWSLWRALLDLQQIKVSKIWKVMKEELSKALKTTCKDDWMVSDEFSGFANAMRRSDADLWKEAIHEELTSLVANETWTLTELPPARKALTTTWVFKVKRDGGGDVERYKARLCVRGFEQREGLDYQEVFAPTSGKSWDS
eukprot:jgi/Pico_ML_1/53349/g3911.t1